MSLINIFLQTFNNRFFSVKFIVSVKSVFSKFCLYLKNCLGLEALNMPFTIQVKQAHKVCVGQNEQVKSL
jgi:hypothetical protein